MRNIKKADLYIFSWILVGILFLLNFAYINYYGNTQYYFEPGFSSGFYMPVDFSYSFWDGIYGIFALAIPCILAIAIIKHDSKLLIVAIAVQPVSIIILFFYIIIAGDQLSAHFVIELLAWLMIAVSYMLVYFKKTFSVERYFVICGLLGSVMALSSIVECIQTGEYYISYIIYLLATSLCFGILAIATDGDQDTLNAYSQTTIQATAKDSGGLPNNQGEVTRIFCTNCGKESDVNASFCAFCGYSINSKGSKTTQTNVATAAEDIESVGINILSFLIPIVGLILFIVWKDATPTRAKSAGKWAIIGAIVGFIGYVVITACTASMLEY